MADRTINSILFANGSLTKLLADDSTNATRTLTFAGDGINASILDVDSTAASVTTVGGSGGLGTLAINIANAAGLRIDFTANSKTLELRSVVSGTKLAVDTVGTVLLTGANTFTGGLDLITGTLAISNNSALGTGTLALIGNNVSLFATGGASISNTADIGSNRAIRFGSASGLTLAGPINLTGTGTNELILHSGVTTFSGTVSGTRQLSLTGSGTLVLRGSNTFVGAINAESGTTL